MQDNIVFDVTIFAVTSNRKVVYVKYSTEAKLYVVKTMIDGIKEEHRRSYSLSDVMYNAADLIATHTGGFTMWENLS